MNDLGALIGYGLVIYGAVIWARKIAATTSEQKKTAAKTAWEVGKWLFKK